MDETQYSLPFVVASAALLWTFGYAVSLKFLTPSALTKCADRSYWASCVVGIVHALYTGLSAARLLYTGELPAWHSFGAPSPAWERVVAVSFGYFAYDFCLVLSDPKMPGRAEMLLHHLLGLTMHFSPVCIYQNFAAISCVGYLCELSTPFVNARWMLKEAGGGSGTRLYAMNGVAIVISFFACRVVGGLAYLYQIFVLVPRYAPPALSDLGLVGKMAPAGALVFYALNLYWMYKILAGAIKLFFPTQRSKTVEKKEYRDRAETVAQSPPHMQGRADAYPIKAD